MFNDFSPATAPEYIQNALDALSGERNVAIQFLGDVIASMQRSINSRFYEPGSEAFSPTMPHLLKALRELQSDEVERARVSLTEAFDESRREHPL